MSDTRNATHLGSAMKGSQKITAKMQLTPQMQQNLKLLSIPIQELQHVISTELKENPALEITENSVESLEEIGSQERKGKDKADKAEFVESLLTFPETLSEHLLWQLRMEAIDDIQFEIGTLIIENLDENGFLKEDIMELLSQVSGGSDAPYTNVSNEEAELVRSIIQELEPVGCATNNVIDSLKVQLDYLPMDKTHRKTMEHFLAQVESTMLSKEVVDIEKTFEILLKDKELQVFAKKLVPYPGRSYASSHVDREVYVIPDAVVIRDFDELRVEVNRDIIPILSINKSIEKVYKQGGKGDKKVASEMIFSAKSFISSLEYRSSVLEKILGYIVTYQQEFFLNEHNYLKPLLGKDVAVALHLNESTVSRVVNNKYVQSDRGIHSLKSFFSKRLGNQGTSTEQVKEEIVRLIQELHDNDKKISDRILSEELQKRGLAIARRTVAKYRGQLNR